MSDTFVEKVCVLGAGSTKYGKLPDSIADITTQSVSFSHRKCRN